MMNRSKLLYFLPVMWALGSTGCVVVSVDHWGVGPTVWTAATTEELALDTEDLKALEVRTHNGSITFQGQAAGSNAASVIVTKQGGGTTLAGAQEALEAIDVFVEQAGDGGQKIGWRWARAQHPGWSARVNFNVKAPGAISFNGHTHNGPVTVEDARGDVRVTTHNGQIDVESSGERLYARSHNGKLNATFTGDEITLFTHNGAVVADLSHCRVVKGSITTHNGQVEVTLGKEASFGLKCRTHNGGIHCDLPLRDMESMNHRLTGTIGSGEGKLNVTTHNGSIRLKKATG